MPPLNEFPTPPSAEHNAALVLSDGSIFFGRGIGAEGSAIGEICFNTSMTGYQEILTDPSYAGQIITFTFPHIGNVGTNEQDIESEAIHARGLILRGNITRDSNFRSQKGLNQLLVERNITGICGIDTRALTNKIRKTGAQNALIVHHKKQKFDWNATIATVQNYPSMKGQELAKHVTTDKTIQWDQGLWEYNPAGCHHPVLNPDDAKYHIVAIDYGVKHNILRHLASNNCKVTLVPATTKASEILAMNPDGIFLSNGPGDPAATAKYALSEINELIESNLPIFGICLGHQLLGTALGCSTEKMHRGHRGANHPVKEIATDRVLITSQNHGFVVSDKNLPDDVEVTHVSLFDGTVQGIASKTRPIFSVQGHPEASPGPHDINYLFASFFELIENSKQPNFKKVS